MPTQKLYCYVDETGQDDRSAFFYVVAVVSDQNQEALRERLLRVEREAKTSGLKWHKTQAKRKILFLTKVLAQKIGQGDVFFSVYPKPIPYFFPLIDILEDTIRQKAVPPYIARVYVDGIDYRKALQLTNALRTKMLSLDLVKSRRDESEPLIRLADMWAGCIRAAREGRTLEQALLVSALRSGYLEELTKQKNP